MINALIVEDSRLARVELKAQLSSLNTKHKIIDVVAEAENIEQALALYQSHDIDLVFLDIDLPDGSGFDFLTQLTPAPKIIFTTAFAEHALKAFEENATDYLLKPYTLQRLTEACNKLILPEHEPKPRQQDKMTLTSQFFVKDGQRCYLVTLAQVERFEAMGNYTRVYFAQEKPMVYRTLAQIEQRLPDKEFFRVSRQNIVQLSQVTHIDICSSGGLELNLLSGDKVEVSRRQASILKSLLAL